MKQKTFAAALMIMLAAPALSLAKEELPPIKVHREGGVDYVSGGIEPLERKALGRLAERYQVQMSFSMEGSDEKLSGVKVTLIDYKGDKAVEMRSEGPIFFANPPPGRWTLQAEFNGDKFSKTLDVNGRFYITLDIRFKVPPTGN
jgi:hypothetical protein